MNLALFVRQGSVLVISESDLIDEEDLFVLRVTLQNVDPAVTREFVVTGDTPLPVLHLIIQVCMGWSNAHFYEFQKGAEKYGTPSEDFPEMKVTDDRGLCVFDLLSQEGDTITYVYDFGDYWEHIVQLITVVPDSDGAVVPVCVAGSMACPPEDVGGPPGFEEFKEAAADPDHSRHDELMDWVGWGWEATDFNIHETNVILGRVFPGVMLDEDELH